MTGSHPIVPESLLAFAKDVRYIEQCKELLSQSLLILSFLPRDNEEGPSPAPPLQLTASLLSSLFYVALVVVKRGRTLGMEALDLSYGHSKWRLITAWVMATLVLYGPQVVVASCCSRSSGTPANNIESLRGDQRRQLFEEQRRRMMERAKESHEVTTTSTKTTTTTTKRRCTSRWQQMMQMISTLANAIVPGLDWSGGPHVLPGRGAGASTSFALGAWLVRLHLAYYLIRGENYPSVMHRLFRLRIRKDSDMLVNRPKNGSSHRAIGFLILAQAIGTAVPAVARLIMARFRTEQDESPTRTSIHFPIAPTQQQQQDGAGRTCAVCRHAPISSPSCPPCGHVFCWTCLQKVTNVRPECPLCRETCLPSQVLALYNYRPEEGE